MKLNILATITIMAILSLAHRSNNYRKRASTKANLETKEQRPEKRRKRKNLNAFACTHFLQHLLSPLHLSHHLALTQHPFFPSSHRLPHLSGRDELLGK